MHRGNALGDDRAWSRPVSSARARADAWPRWRCPRRWWSRRKSSTFGCLSRVRAMQRRCFCPPETLTPPCPRSVSRPSGIRSKNSSAQAARQAAHSCLVVGVRVAPLQVVPDGAGEEHVLLQHNAHGVPQGGQVVVPHVAAADPHGALGGVVQAGDQLDQRGLGRAGAADDAHGLPRQGCAA